MFSPFFPWVAEPQLPLTELQTAASESWWHLIYSVPVFIPTLYQNILILYLNKFLKSFNKLR